MPASFDTSVFINCPFDRRYQRLLEATLFCVIRIGLEPRIALERSNAAETRIAKILQLVEEAKYGIHDLSRLKAQKKGEFYRLNMPLELGLDLGCQRWGQGRLRDKKCLVLEAQRYQYQTAISDLAGSDIAAHGNRIEGVLTEVRNWLCHQTRLDAPPPAALLGQYADFVADARAGLAAEGYSEKDMKRLPIPDFIDRAKAWTRSNPWPPS